MKIFLLIACLASFIVQSQGQTNKSRIDKKDLIKIMRVLTSDSLQGRGTGTEGQRRAMKFISDRFRDLGLSAYNQDGYLEKFKLNEFYWGQVYVKINGRTLKNFENMFLYGNDSQNEEVEKEIVFGGRGTDEELSQVEVKGRLVLVLFKT